MSGFENFDYKIDADFQMLLLFEWNIFKFAGHPQKIISFKIMLGILCRIFFDTLHVNGGSDSVYEASVGVLPLID